MAKASAVPVFPKLTPQPKLDEIAADAKKITQAPPPAGSATRAPAEITITKK